MQTEFLPFQSLAGGALIGLAATLLMLTQGRIFGVTGMIAHFTAPGAFREWSWRAALLIGAISAPFAYMLIVGDLPEVTVSAPTFLIVVGGFLIGAGATYGSGCTSGHGVCGLARFSLRSLAAVMTFVTVTGLTVFVIRHLVGG